MSQETRRAFLKKCAIGTAAAVIAPVLSKCSAVRKQPNFIVIFCDDMGYGDLSCFGHPTIHTKNLDTLAAEGQKWTSFYSAAPVCTPSRAGLMTGRLPIRNGMCSNKRGVLFPDSASGLQPEEITIARALKDVGYKTGCVGKWHLGHLKPYLPISHGFDSYFGIPYSNDMDQVKSLSIPEHLDPKVDNYNVPLMQDEEIIERPCDQTTITKRYNEKALEFIRDNKNDPFFLYLAHSMVHIPLFASDKVRGKSPRGLFGDCVLEIDNGVGRIVKLLKELGIDDNTMIVFTSDNGPWLIFNQHSGTAGLLREGKNTTWEGGMREPTIFWMPGKIEPGIVSDMGSTMDLFATFCKMSGATVPSDRQMDTNDLTPTLFNGKGSSRETMFYYHGANLFAVRKGAFKLHFASHSRAYTPEKETVYYKDDPLLFNVDVDPGEHFNIAAENPGIVKELTEVAEQHKQDLIPGEDQLAKRL